MKLEFDDGELTGIAADALAVAICHAHHRSSPQAAALLALAAEAAP